jgi:hypothetical protein
MATLKELYVTENIIIGFLILTFNAFKTID